jgi:hypothetical protein
MFVSMSPIAALQAQSEMHIANCAMHPRVMHVQQASSAEPVGADGRTPGVQDASVSGAEPGGAELPKGGAEPPDGPELPAGPSVAEAAGVDEGLGMPTAPPESGAAPAPASCPPVCPPHAQASTNMRDRIGDAPVVRVGMVNLTRPSMRVSASGKKIADRGSARGLGPLSS